MDPRFFPIGFAAKSGRLDGSGQEYVSMINGVVG